MRRFRLSFVRTILYGMRKYIIRPHKRPTILYTVARVVVIYLATDMHSNPTYPAAPFELLDVIQVNIAIISPTAFPIISRVRKAVRVSSIPH
ncbi:unnamed protein product [Penicillium camemberti]|uniref:Str. FM013 n=1 Tax=Penicillium camemberti (strain FM 013) TaxID=1429867 RepID=A0A0G4NYT5_PENC3|nr:unnamed protein product [Penicillium camemberti]